MACSFDAQHERLVLKLRPPTRRAQTKDGLDVSPVNGNILQLCSYQPVRAAKRPDRLLSPARTRHAPRGVAGHCYATYRSRRRVKTGFQRRQASRRPLRRCRGGRRDALLREAAGCREVAGSEPRLPAQGPTAHSSAVLHVDTRQADTWTAWSTVATDTRHAPRHTAVHADTYKFAFGVPAFCFLRPSCNGACAGGVEACVSR